MNFFCQRKGRLEGLPKGIETRKCITSNLLSDLHASVR